MTRPGLLRASSPERPTASRASGEAGRQSPRLHRLFLNVDSRSAGPPISSASFQVNRWGIRITPDSRRLVDVRSR